jgi:site-specific DNA-cytosine methylase
MRVLIACEESQAVCIEFRKLGHEAFSCDLQECSAGHPEWHIKEDALDVMNWKGLNGSEYWDMMIAFPPCTHLAVSGAAWFEQKRKDGRQRHGINFFLGLAGTKIPKWAIENPVGIMSSHFRKPNQIIQPFMFGDPVKKTTCIWSRGLPRLQPTNIVEPEITTLKTGAKFSTWDYKISMNHKERAKLRSKTFPGIAKAMAEQWGNL